MPFGLTKTPTSFQSMIDAIFKDMEGCICYLVDILIYGGNNKVEDQAIVKKVLQQYVEYCLILHIRNSEFYVHEAIFLVHVINGQEVKIDSPKLETMSKWPIHTKKKEVQVFSCFTNYYN